MASSWVSALRIVRPLNATLAAVAAVVGALVVLPRPVSANQALMLIQAAFSAFCGVGGANALNDAGDASIDAVAHPDRPVPRGLVSVYDARFLGWIFLLLALAVAASAGPRALAVAAILFCLVLAYEFALKQVALLGNALIALIVALVFVLGAATASRGWSGADSSTWLARWPLIAMMSGLAFVANLSRELFKTVEDASADAAARLTVAELWGRRATSMVASALLLLTVPLVVLVGWLHVGPWWTSWSLMPAVVVFVASAFLRPVSRAQRGAKLGMALALFSFLAIGLL